MSTIHYIPLKTEFALAASSFYSRFANARINDGTEWLEDGGMSSESSELS